MITPQTSVIPGSHFDGRNFLRTRLRGMTLVNNYSISIVKHILRGKLEEAIRLWDVNTESRV